MVPALLVGGVLSGIDERLLEVPIVCLGIAWITVGWAALRQPAIGRAARFLDEPGGFQPVEQPRHP